jgi:hypothetical protein
MKPSQIIRQKQIAVINVLLIIMFLLSSMTLKGQTLTNFSGQWKLNLLKSSPVPPLLSSTLVITQKGNEIAFTTTNTIKDQKPLTHSEDYIIGGGLQSKTEEKTRILTSAWGPDKKTFSITETYIFDKDGTKKEFKKVTVYSLTDMGKTLNVISDDSLPEMPAVPDKRIHTVSVYNK